MLEDAARKYGFLVLALALVFVLAFSENGVVEFLRLKSRVTAVDASINKLKGENIALQGELERLSKDDRYLEDVARSRFGFIREGEKVYRFGK